MRNIDRTGKRYGKLVVISLAGRSAKNRPQWLCKCDCGADYLIESYRMKRAKSCGCGVIDALILRNTKHGKSYSPEFRIWSGMITRCENKNRSYFKNYGGRGIKVCARWRKSFAAFLEDMGTRPTSKHTIERKDVNGNYSKNNCCWATQSRQSRNKRDTPKVSVRGKMVPIIDIYESRPCHISIRSFRRRILVAGMSIEEAFTSPKTSGYR